MEETIEIDRPGPEPQGVHPFYWIITMAMALLAFIVTPNFMRARARGSMTSCKSNCKNTATALEMYATDNHGLYPRYLPDLVPGNYLKQIPTCPAAGNDTYSASYQVSIDGKAFSFVCTGNNHAKSYAGFKRPSDNFPQYNSRDGLIDHP